MMVRRVRVLAKRAERFDRTDWVNVVMWISEKWRRITSISWCCRVRDQHYALETLLCACVFCQRAAGLGNKDIFQGDLFRRESLDRGAILR